MSKKLMFYIYIFGILLAIVPIKTNAINPEDENSVAWLLQQIFNFVKIVGPILVVVLSSIDYAKVIIQSDDESMGKANKKLMWRLILAALLFFIPLLIQVFLQMFGFTSDPTCGIH